MGALQRPLWMRQRRARAGANYNPILNSAVYHLNPILALMLQAHPQYVNRPIILIKEGTKKRKETITLLARPHPPHPCGGAPLGLARGRGLGPL